MIKTTEEIIRNLNLCIRNPKSCGECTMEWKGEPSSCIARLMEAALFLIYDLQNKCKVDSESSQEPVQAPEPWTREKVLAEAKRCVCGERDQSYGGPEDSFRLIAKLWEPYIKEKIVPKGTPVDIKPEDVAIMMGMLKVARLASNPTHMDSWVDLAGYAACGGEIAGKEVQE